MAMSEPFEHDLARRFAETPTLPDSAGFAAAVQARLERGWRMRRLLIGTAGSMGGLLAAFQISQADLVGRAAAVSHSADDRAHGFAAVLLARSGALVHLHGLAAEGEVLWMVAGLGAVGLALATARLMDAF